MSDNYFDGLDCYRQARDITLKRIFPDYPDLQFETFTMRFIIKKSDYSFLIFLIIDTLPEQNKLIENDKVEIHVQLEIDFLEHLRKVYEILSIVKGWKGLEMTFNHQSIDHLTLRYLVSYFCDKHNISEPKHYYEKKDLKRKYTGGNRKSRAKDYPTTDLFGKTIEESFPLIVDKYINTYASNCSIERIQLTDQRLFLIIEDSLVLEFFISKGGFNLLINEVEPEEHSYDCLIIQELSPNQLFQVNNAAFNRSFKNKRGVIEYIRFDGIQSYRNDKHCFKVIDKAFPELKLQQRFDDFPGINHHFIVLEMKNQDRSIARCVGSTDKKVHSYVLRICNELLETGTATLRKYGLSGFSYSMESDFIEAFLSWKGKKKQWRLENIFSYYYIDKTIKDDMEISNEISKILSAASKGLHDAFERGGYTKPNNRWKTEELVLNIVKKIYGEYQVIAQYKPYFLHSDKGQLSYDVYICGLKVAVEYQGKQHFEPVEYFGGKESHEAQKERDLLKKKLSDENGISLVYINYWDDVTPDVIKGRIEEALSERSTHPQKLKTFKK